MKKMIIISSSAILLASLAFTLMLNNLHRRSYEKDWQLYYDRFMNLDVKDLSGGDPTDFFRPSIRSSGSIENIRELKATIFAEWRTRENASEAMDHPHTQINMDHYFSVLLPNDCVYETTAIAENTNGSLLDLSYLPVNRVTKDFKKWGDPKKNLYWLYKIKASVHPDRYFPRYFCVAHSPNHKEKAILIYLSADE